MQKQSGCLLLFFSSLFITTTISQIEKIQVKTRFGELRGFLSQPFNDSRQAEIYLNIPYALPPIGRLRFEKPKPYNYTWPEGRDAYEFGPACVPVINDLNQSVSEDCLTLNVFRPHKHLLPVLVYVHGGGFAFGSSSIYGFQHLAANYVLQNLVVVTLQSCDISGFASIGHSSYSANLGLWDQALAFKWIRNNIEDFGGDPNRVTAQGLSAGGASVGLLALSPHSRDNIHQLIEMSGSANAPWAVNDETVKYTRKFADQIGCRVDDDDGVAFKKCLSQMTTEDFVNAMKKFVSY